MVRFFVFTSLLALGLMGCESSTSSTGETKPAAVEKTAKKAPASQPAHADEHGDEHGKHDVKTGGKLGKGENPADRDQKDADGIVRRGPKLADGKVLSVQECTAALNGKSVKVEGKVAQVCAKKGCWFVIEDDKKQQVRITSKDYKFFVPRDAVGKKAVVEGVLTLKEMSVAEAQHMADDAAESTGKPAEKITEGKKEMRIAAVSLELR